MAPACGFKVDIGDMRELYEVNCPFCLRILGEVGEALPTDADMDAIRDTLVRLEALFPTQRARVHAVMIGIFTGAMESSKGFSRDEALKWVLSAMNARIVNETPQH